MNKALALLSASLLVALALTGVGCNSMKHDDSAKSMAMDPKKMQEMMAKCAAVGPQQQMLGQFVGNFKAEIRYSMGPGTPEQTTTGMSKNEMVYGGRFLHQEYSGTFEGQPYNGSGLVGYDNLSGKYQSTWADSMNTGITMAQGSGSADGKTLNLRGTMTDPMTGKPSGYRQVMRIIDENHYVLEWYDQMAGHENKSMTITYTKM